jgi:hypothetical protein
MSFKQVGYTFKSVVITAGPPIPGPDTFGAANSGGAPGTQHDINLSIPAGNKLFAVWYTPMDRINVLTQFALIDVRLKGDTDVTLELSAVPGANAFLRIQIHVLYGVAA